MASSTSGWHRKASNTPATTARARQYRSREHRTLRTTYQAHVDQGAAHCWRCGAWLPPGRPWHLGHDDNDRTIYRGPECPPCNLKAGARKGARAANAARRRTSGTTNRRATPSATQPAWRSRAW